MCLMWLVLGTFLLGFSVSPKHFSIRVWLGLGHFCSMI